MYVVVTDTGFGTTGGFGTSAFGTTTNTGGLFGSTQNKPGLSFIVCLFLLSVHEPNVGIDEISANTNHLSDGICGFNKKNQLLIKNIYPFNQFTIAGSGVRVSAENKQTNNESQSFIKCLPLNLCIHEGLVLVSVSQVDFLGPVHSVSRPLHPPALVLVLGPPAAHQAACLATLALAPQADSSHSKTMHSAPTNPLLSGVSSVIICL